LKTSSRNSREVSVRSAPANFGYRQGARNLQLRGRIAILNLPMRWRVEPRIANPFHTLLGKVLP